MPPPLFLCRGESSVHCETALSDSRATTLRARPPRVSHDPVTCSDPRKMKEGAELLKHGATLTLRAKGAEFQINALFYDHRAAVLRGTEPRRSFFDLVTELDISGKFDSRYGKDVADELSRQFSKRPRR